MWQKCSVAAKKRFQMRVIGADGDSGITWDPTDAESMERARQYFAVHAASLYLAFQDVEGVGHHIPYGEFDPAVHNNVLFGPVPVPG